MKLFWDALFEDDLSRVRLGRFSDADEKMMEQMVRGRPNLFGSFGRGRYAVDLRVPGVFSSRPSTPEGGQTFTFHHDWVRKRYQRPVPRDRLYILAPRADGEALRAAGAKWDRKVRIQGRTGGWYVPAGTPVPTGTRLAAEDSVRPRTTGHLPGTAAAKQKYIERPEALDADAVGAISIGSLGDDPDTRHRFWTDLEAVERGDGRVQAQIIAELPYEEAVGPEGRRRIVEAFGKRLEAIGMAWHGVVHRPDDHSDARNFHMHLVFAERGADLGADGVWRFARTKNEIARDRNFIKILRQDFADTVNTELEQAGIRRRLDPRRYEAMGIPKEPGLHLGPAAAALERKGVVTAHGRVNYAREWFYRLGAFGTASAVETRRDRDGLAAAAQAVDRSRRYISGEVENAADRVAELGEAFVEAAEEHQRRKTEAEVERWRGHDLALRPEAAASAHEDAAVRREAQGVATSILAWTAETDRRARGRVLESRGRLREARRRLSESVRRLEAEIMLAERARLAASLRRALESLDDGRMDETAWRRRGDALERELGERRRRHGEIADGLTQELSAERAPEDAARLAARLADRRRRKRALGRLGRGDKRAREAVRRLARLETRIAELEGDRKKRQRDEKDEKRFRRRVRSAAETASLQARVRAAERALREMDANLVAEPNAYRLARERGIAERLGRERAVQRPVRERE